MSDGPSQLDDCLSIREGELYVEGCSAQALAEEFGTPLYVISEDQLRRNAQRLRDAFATRWAGPFLLLPSIKANPALALRRVLTEEGTGCDVFGEGELEAALRTGTEPARISLNGPMKSTSLLERAIGKGVRITLDSRSELDRTIEVATRIDRVAHVRLRIRPDLAGQEQPSEMAPDGSSVRRALGRYKAGIPTEDVLAIAEAQIRHPQIDAAGIHLHLGRHSADPQMWGAAIEHLLRVLAELRNRWNGWAPRELDMGGGFPAPRDPFGRALPQRRNAPPRSPDIDAYAEVICRDLTVGLRRLDIVPGEIQLEIEPGRSLYADAGIHLATVGNVKRETAPEPLTWVETDSSDAYLADVNLEFNRWTALPVLNADAAPAIVADITGRTCALDVIVPDAELPEIEAGEVVAFLDTGAYQDAGATNFNALPRPGTALVHGIRAEMIRRHETLDDVFGRDLIPKRLRKQGAPSRVRELDHVAITCGDLDRSLWFYCDLLGIELRGRGDAVGEEFEVTGIANATVRWADLELRHGQVLELIEYVAPRGDAIRPKPNDPGSTHISLRVSDVHATYRRLRDADVEVVSEPVTIETPGPWHGASVFYSSDPDGVTIELIEPIGPV